MRVAAVPNLWRAQTRYVETGGSAAYKRTKIGGAVGRMIKACAQRVRREQSVRRVCVSVRARERERGKEERREEEAW